MVPSIIGFALSFFVISNYWRAHHRLFRWVVNYDDTFVTLNLLHHAFGVVHPLPECVLQRLSELSDAADFLLREPDHRRRAQVRALASYVSCRPELLRVYPLPHEIMVMGRRTLVVPLVSVLAILGSFVALWHTGLLLMLIPVFLRIVTRLARPSAR